MAGFVLQSILTTDETAYVLDSIEASVAELTLSTVFDTGNVSASLSSVTDPDSETPLVWLDTRPGANTNNGWRHATVILNNALGKRPIFRLNRATRGVTTNPTTSWLPAYTYDWDDFESWVRAPSRSLVGGTSGYIEWQFSEAFTENTVVVSTHPNGRQADVETYAAYLLSLPQAEPTGSADENGVYFTSPSETDDISREVGGHPMYAIKLAWGGSTTDGGPKRKLVLGTHIHAAGEAVSWISHLYMMRWIIESASDAAVAFRSNWDIYWYGAIFPNSLFGGADRVPWRSSLDPNRDFPVGASAYAEIQAFRDAVIADTGGYADAFIVWHTWGASTSNKRFNIAWDLRDQNSETRTPAAQAFYDIGTSVFGETPGDISGSTTVNGNAFAVRSLNAPVAFSAEVNQNGSTALSEYQLIGENWAKTLQFTDAEGFFWSPVSAPDNLSGEQINANTIRLTWDAVSGADGYEIDIDEGTPIDVGDVTQYDATPLSVGSYDFRIRSYDEFGAGPWSSPIAVSVVEPGPAPVEVTSVSPTSGSAGITLTITGSGFQSGATVTIGGVSATSVTVVNATTITCTVPAQP
jgi:hypothetical protein